MNTQMTDDARFYLSLTQRADRFRQGTDNYDKAVSVADAAYARGVQAYGRAFAHKVVDLKEGY